MTHAVVTSFDYKSLCILKRQAPDIKIGLTYSNDFVHHYQVTQLVDVPVYSIQPSHLRINRQDVQDALSRGLQVFAYTVNDESDMRRVIDYGVSGILTDCPRKLFALLNR